MPYKFQTDKLKIPRCKDRRVKLTDQERDEIKRLYGKISQRKLASLYGVSRRLIQFIGDPSKHEQNLKRRSERGGSMIYYNKEKHTTQIREHRQYKNELNKNKELI